MAAAQNQVAVILKKLAMFDYRIGEKYWVDVTHIRNPHNFYVRPVLFREDLAYLQEVLNPLKPDDAQVGKLIVYKSESLDMYVRGDIVKVVKQDGDIICNIKAIDYGCEDKMVPLWRLNNPKNDINVPPLVAHCLLADCRSLEEGTWADDTTEAMKSFVGNERARMIIKGRTLDQLVVELINSCPNDIATMLTLTGYTTIGSSADMPVGHRDNPPFEGRYFECKNVNVGDVLHVRSQTGKDLSCFYVAEVGDFGQYLRHRNDFSDYCMYQKTPRINDLGIGRGVGYKSQFMLKFERSVVKEIICPTKVAVQQIDWGDVQEANLNQLKLVKPMIFGQTTAVALYCRASANQIESIEPSAFLYPGVEFLITIKEVGENFNTPHIVDISELSTK